MSKDSSTPMTRKHLSRLQRERQMERYIWISLAVVAVVVLGLLGFAALNEAVLKPRQAVARVEGTTVTLGEFQKMVRYQRFQIIRRQYYPLLSAAQLFAGDEQSQQYYVNQLQQVVNYLADSNTLGQQVLDELVNNQLILAEAKRRGITVSAEEVEARLREGFGYYPNGTPVPTTTPTEPPTDVPPTVNPTTLAAWTPTPTLTPTATLAPSATPTSGPSPTAEPSRTPRPTTTPLSAEGYATNVISLTKDLDSEASLSQADLRHFIEMDLYREKLSEAISAGVPNTAEQVRARHILVADEETAKTVYALVTQGKDWDETAAQFSQDPSNADQGGYLGWFGMGDMVSEFETAAFSLQPGEISQPVQTSFGWHIIQVLDRGPRPLNSEQMSRAHSQAFDDWLQSRREALDASGKPIVETFDLWRDFVPTEPALPSAQ